MKMFEKITPKYLIYSQIEKQMRATDTTVIILDYNTTDGSYKVFRNFDTEPMQVNLAPKEENTIKAMLIDNIIKQWKRRYDIEPAGITFKISINSEDKLEINTYIKDFKEKMFIFDNEKLL